MNNSIFSYGVISSQNIAAPLTSIFNNLLHDFLNIFQTKFAQTGGEGDPTDGPIGDRPKVTKVQVEVTSPDPLTKSVVIRFTTSHPGNLNLPITLKYANGSVHKVMGTKTIENGKVVFSTDLPEFLNPGVNVVDVLHTPDKLVTYDHRNTSI